jgi:hypothetical protein
VDTLVFFFDRTFGVRLPKALASLKPPVRIKWHQDEGFAQNMPDDDWLAIVGPRRWIVLSQDRKFHLYPNQLLAIKQHDIRCFYLPCASDSRWISLCHFVHAYERMVEVARNQKPPFIYEMAGNRQFIAVDLR